MLNTRFYHLQIPTDTLVPASDHDTILSPARSKGSADSCDVRRGFGDVNEGAVAADERIGGRTMLPTEDRPPLGAAGDVCKEI